MKQTAIMKLVDRFKELDASHMHLTSTNIIKILEESMKEEESQIKQAFDEGMEFGKDYVHMDYPSSRYYFGIYKDPERK